MGVFDASTLVFAILLAILMLHACDVINLRGLRALESRITRRRHS